ncbi:MAG: endonuclease/exonuclease/phosphatase family protein [Lachnospiraceae bacterium]|nr:endonuclease/exonuclease/phosphatase family protein [Lachnospiraceae bacterium]
MVKNVLKIAGIVVGVILLVVIVYVLYVILSYKRIEDNKALKPEGNAKVKELKVEEEYTVVTQNCGFGAYTADFTFFMDGGTESRAKSKESAIKCMDMAAEEVKSHDPDFVLLQEVDTDSTRSHHINQLKQMKEHFTDYESVFAVNWNSAYLMYPLLKPHGEADSGILTFSNTDITSALRRSLTVSKSLSKLVDLDRCYSVSRIPVDNGKEMVLYNVHSSAYGGSDEIRTAQITKLTKDMEAEYKKGNYCVCGGDFNHDFTGDSAKKLGSKNIESAGWAQPFPKELLPEGISQCLDYDDEKLIPSCRNCDVPYGPDCAVLIVDGFLISDNVEMTELHNVNVDFSYSDHQPVVMKFRLK